MIFGNQSIYNYAPWQNLANKENMHNYNYENNWVLKTYIPFREINHSSIMNGSIPLWNSKNLAGIPHIANYQSSFFYPLTFIVSIFGWRYAWGWMCLFKLLIAGIGFFLLIKLFNISFSVAIVSSIIYMFNGFHMTWLHAAHINSAILLPWIFLFGLRYIKRKEIWNKDGIIFSVLFGIMWLGGHPETQAYITLGLFLLFSIFIFQNNNNKVVGMKVAGTIMIIMFIGVLLAGLQVFPFIEYLLNSTRNIQHGGFDNLFLPIYSIINYIFPDIFGNPVDSNFWAWDFGPYFSYQEITGYIGILPILLVFFTFRKKDLYSPYLIFFIIFLPFVYYIPVISDLIEKLPLLGVARSSKGILLITFVITIMFTFKLQDLVDHKIQITKKPLVVFLVITVIGFLISLMVKDDAIHLISQYSNRVSEEDLSNIGLLIQQNIYQLFFLLMALILLFIFQSRLINLMRIKHLFISFILIFCFLDLYKHFSYYNSFTYNEKVYPESKIANYISANIGQYERVFCLEDNIFPAHINNMYGFSSLDGYATLGLPAQKKIKKRIRQEFQNKSKLYSSIEFDTRPIINLLNIRYLLTTSEKIIIGFQNVFSSNGINIWENPDRKGLVTFYSQFENDPNNYIYQKDKNIYQSEKLYPDSHSLVNSELLERKFSKSAVKNPRFIHEGNAIHIDLSDFHDSGYVFISENYYPGWYAEVDGIERPVIKANLFGKTVAISKSDEHLKLYYRPNSFVAGLISTGSIILLLILSSVLLSKKKKIKRGNFYTANTF